MKKKYSIAFMGITLCFIIIGSYLIFTNNQIVRVTPMEVFSQKEPITFMSSWGAYDSRAIKINKVLGEIERANHDLMIENTSIAGSEFLYGLKMDFASGCEPDIFGLWPGSDINLLIKKGKIADLTDLLRANPSWYKCFKTSTWNMVTVDGRIYGLPIELIYEALFINRDLFEKYGVKVPTTYQELLEAIDIFKENGVIPIAYNQTSEGSYLYQNMVMKLGGKEDVEQPFDENGKLKPCFKQGMYYLKELYDRGAFPKNWYELDDKKRNELFVDKKAAMIVQGSWLIGDQGLNSMDSKVDVVPFPDMPGGKADSTAIIYGCGNGILHISTKAWNNPEKKKQCIEVLKTLSSPKSVAILAQSAGYISNIDLGEYTPQETLMGKKGKDLIEQSAELVGAADWYINRNIWENVMIKAFPQILKGKMTPEMLCEMVEQEMQMLNE